MTTLVKKLVVAASAVAIGSAVDKAAPRQTGTYPTTTRLGAVIVGAIAVNYAAAWLEKQLDLHD
jgi:hypothetical protein